MATGVILKHDNLCNSLFVVEDPSRPYSDGGFDCNLCPGRHHAVKAIHLALEPDGTCIVSVGVLRELRRAGMPQLSVWGHTDSPPPLRFTPGKTRAEIDNENRRIWVPSGLTLREKVANG